MADFLKFKVISEAAYAFGVGGPLRLPIAAW